MEDKTNPLAREARDRMVDNAETLDVSLGDLKEYLNHPVTRQIQEMLKINLEQVKGDLMMGFELELNQIRILQAEAAMVQAYLDMPTLFMEHIAEKTARAEGEENE